MTLIYKRRSGLYNSADRAFPCLGTQCGQDGENPRIVTGVFCLCVLGRCLWSLAFPKEESLETYFKMAREGQLFDAAAHSVGRDNEKTKSYGDQWKESVDRIFMPLSPWPFVDLWGQGKERFRILKFYKKTIEQSCPPHQFFDVEGLAEAPERYVVDGIYLVRIKQKPVVRIGLSRVVMDSEAPARLTASVIDFIPS